LIYFNYRKKGYYNRDYYRPRIPRNLNIIPINTIRKGTI